MSLSPVELASLWKQRDEIFMCVGRATLKFIEADFRTEGVNDVLRDKKENVEVWAEEVRGRTAQTCLRQLSRETLLGKKNFPLSNVVGTTYFTPRREQVSRTQGVQGPRFSSRILWIATSV